MTLKRAKQIAKLITDIGNDRKQSCYVAKIKRHPYYEFEYSVMLSSNSDFRIFYANLICFVRALVILGQKLEVCYGDDYVEIS